MTEERTDKYWQTTALCLHCTLWAESLAWEVSQCCMGCAQQKTCPFSGDSSLLHWQLRIHECTGDIYSALSSSPPSGSCVPVSSELHTPLLWGSFFSLGWDEFASGPLPHLSSDLKMLLTKIKTTCMPLLPLHMIFMLNLIYLHTVKLKHYYLVLVNNWRIVISFHGYAFYIKKILYKLNKSRMNYSLSHW